MSRKKVLLYRLYLCYIRPALNAKAGTDRSPHDPIRLPNPAKQRKGESFMRLQNKVALITGAARGIGRAIAEAFSREGAALILADIQEGEVQALTEKLQAQGRKALPIPVNVCLRQEVQAMVEKSLQEMGRIDILINSVGGGKYVPLAEMTEDEWDTMIDFNLKSVFLCCRAVFPHMISRKYGRIVNIASLAGRGTSETGGVHYTAAKAGVLGFTRHLAREAGPYGITVNAVAPGPTLTDRLRAKLSPEREAEIARRAPLGRLGHPEDPAGAALFLASDEASFVTGATIDVNGGLLMM
jgi:NAD(P)-dependent dehydrogenase (short-subunit alcohol dehydrogenase family)